MRDPFLNKKDNSKWDKNEGNLGLQGKNETWNYENHWFIIMALFSGQPVSQQLIQIVIIYILVKTGHIATSSAQNHRMKFWGCYHPMVLSLGLSWSLHQLECGHSTLII